MIWPSFELELADHPMNLADENQFFRDLTLRICSNLEIEKGLYESFLCLEKYIPTDRLYLQRYEPELRSMRMVARADKERQQKMNLLITLTREAKLEMAAAAEERKGGNYPEVFVFNQPQTSAISTCMLNALNEPLSSIMVLPLVIEEQMTGAFVVLARGENRFNEEHVSLYASLKKPFTIAMSNYMEHQEVIKLQNMLTDENQFLRGELHRLAGDEIIGTHFGLREVMQQVQQVAPIDSPVLLSGETGVGKDVIANAIHFSSKRNDGPFISVNCGAIPESLIDSELFGHEKGAFTGAMTQKKGRFERANGGTIFLDEIGELPFEAQVRLLRVIQNKEIERVGGTQTITLDIRIIAATNKNLEDLVSEGKFREDLWFRLNVFPIWIPPLRERKQDLPALLQHFIHTKTKELKLPAIPELSPAAVESLFEYDWPGNVRELQNIVERALIINPAGPLSFGRILRPSLNSRSNNKRSDNLDEMITRHIQQVLNKTSGKIHGPGGAAERLGVNANTLRNRMNKLGIDYKKDRIT